METRITQPPADRPALPGGARLIALALLVLVASLLGCGAPCEYGLCLSSCSVGPDQGRICHSPNRAGYAANCWCGAVCPADARGSTSPQCASSEFCWGSNTEGLNNTGPTCVDSCWFAPNQQVCL